MRVLLGVTQSEQEKDYTKKRRFSFWENKLFLPLSTTPAYQNLDSILKLWLSYFRCNRSIPVFVEQFESFLKFSHLLVGQVVHQGCVRRRGRVDGVDGVRGLSGGRHAVGLDLAAVAVG